MNAAQQYQYVFDNLKRNMLVFSLVPAGTVLLIFLAGRIRPRHYTDKYDRPRDRVKDSKNAFIIFMLLFALLYGTLFYQLRIFRHCSITTGRLINKEYHRAKGSGGWQYTYEYKAGSKIYQEDEVYTQRLTGSVSAGKCYTVLYDSTDPGNAIMLLHEERACTVEN